MRVAIWLFVLWLVPAVAHAETGRAAWLRYAPLESDAAARADAVVPHVVTRLDDDAPVQAAEQELRDGVERMLRKLASGEALDEHNDRQVPYAPIRWVNQWDNLDGSIERGYGGRSIFWADGHARSDLSRVGDYGRLLASLGVNGCSINNVNADPRVLASDFIPEVARIAEALRPWGVQVVLAIDLGSPKTLGGLETFDPVDPQVAAWWKTKADELYRAVPDLGGFVMKADSEGRAGPSAYGRTHADAANAAARALAPHGGLLFYRAFVYDHHLDWRNMKNDRALA